MNETSLRFRNGKFRVLCVSDVHGIKDFDTRAVRDLTAIVDKAEPDLVLFLGDNVWHDGAESEETLRNFMSALIAPLHARNIPWAHVFGNHDAEKGFTVKDQQPIYESLPGCLSSAGPEDISGTGNWVLQVKQEHGEKTVFNIWGLDSGRGIGEFLSDYGFERDARLAKLEDPLYVSSGYDVIRFDQIMWYWNESKRIEAENGYKVPGMMVFHIAVPEYVLPYRNPAQTKYKGTMRETVGSGPINTGLFATLVQRGDVKTLVCGHDHINDTEGEYLGIKLTYDAGLGYDGYCAGDLRGGRIVEIDENDPWHAKTYMIRSSECVDGYEFESTLM